MTNKKRSFFSRIRLAHPRSNLLMKAVILCCVVLCMVTLLTLRGQLLQLQAQTEALRWQAAELEQENAKLEQSISEIGTVQGITRIAKEELGLVDPGVTIFVPEQ